MNTKRQRIRRLLVILSFLLFPVSFYYLSPYLIIHGAWEGVVNGSFILFALLFLSALFLGRAWCGWVCPAGGLQDICTAVQNKPVARGNWVKWLIWLPWLALIAFLALRAGGYKTIDPWYQTDRGISLTTAEIHSYYIYYVVIGLIVALSLLVGRRSACHHICWMAPFMILGRKIGNLCGWPALHLRSEPEKCNNCGRCAKECPMSLDVGAMAASNRMENAECTLCGTCVDVCPRKAVRFAWKRPRAGRAAARGAAKVPAA